MERSKKANPSIKEREGLISKRSRWSKGSRCIVEQWISKVLSERGREGGILLWREATRQEPLFRRMTKSSGLISFNASHRDLIRPLATWTSRPTGPTTSLTLAHFPTFGALDMTFSWARIDGEIDARIQKNWLNFVCLFRTGAQWYILRQWPSAPNKARVKREGRGGCLKMLFAFSVLNLFWIQCQS